MKKLICLIATLMVILCACGNNADNNTAPDGMVEDNNGIIDENDNTNRDNQSGVGEAVDDVADGTGKVIDGASNAAEDIIDGTKNAAEDIVGGAKGAADSVTNNNNK